ncbi:flagellar hook-basal body protein [Lyticum sinuosum]|uniref:Flagellar basal-body rod protein FlgG n=1 Tax=Lyticum sinuosum TaxID=1332059 RepID=A0AAE5AGL4_9RICK|nr:flagellar hook-basal body complex protein [Lyticum sinuosum]MDZ5760892.1 Flagellar basal-body rod protein FlgG [Lyticum sinuosum]
MYSSASSGMNAAMTQVNVVSHNIANQQSPGFKEASPIFSDLIYMNDQRVGGPLSSNSDGLQPIGIQIGTGVRTSAVVRDFRQGETVYTGSDLNIAVIGDGFLQVTLPDGSIAYTRDGNLQIDPVTSQLVTNSGYIVQPGIVIPQNYKKIIIKRDGTVLAEISNEVAPQQLGKLQLTRFINNNGLYARGDNLYIETDAAVPIDGNPDEDSFGYILQGSTEGSNINSINQVIKLVNGRQWYEFNAQAFKVLSEIIGITVKMAGGGV